MWILHFLPDSLILFATNALLIAGIVLVIAGLFAHRIPVIWQYQLPFKILGILLLASGVYLRGGYGVEMAWRERVHEAEEQVKKYQDQAEDLNKKLAEAEKNKITYIQGRVQIVKQYIDREVKVYDGKFGPGGTCAFPQEFINAHNQSAAKPEERK